MAARSRRPRYRDRRVHSRNYNRFLSAMEAKWDGEETPITASSVGSDVLAMASTPDSKGPWTLRGALPPELRGGQFWISVDESDNATLYHSLADLKAGRHPIEIASWDVSPDIKSLDDGVTAVVATTEAGTTVATLGTPVEIESVANATETFTITGHGYSVDDGPFQFTNSGGALPSGISAATDYWIRTVPTADTFTVTAVKGGDVALLADDGTGTHSIVPVNVDRAENYLHKAAHGLATGQLVRLTTDGALPTGLSANTNYWAIAVSSDILAFAASLEDSASGTKVDITAIGSGTTTVLKCNIDTTTEVFTKAAHGFVTGDAVQVSTSSALPTGVSAATTYYVIRVSADTFKLAATEADALAETPAIDITAIGAGNQTFTLCRVDLTADSFRLDDHGMVTGDGPVRFTTSDALPTGVSAGVDYWIIRLDADRFSIATSLANALLGTDVNITAVGSGTHQLVRTLTMGKDLTAAGIHKWLGQGVSYDRIKYGATADVDSIFV